MHIYISGKFEQKGPGLAMAQSCGSTNGSVVVETFCLCIIWEAEPVMKKQSERLAHRAAAPRLTLTYIYIYMCVCVYIYLYILYLFMYVY